MFLSNFDFGLFFGGGDMIDKMNNKLGIKLSVVGVKHFTPFFDEEGTYYYIALWTTHKFFQYMEAGIPYITGISYSPERNFFATLGGGILLTTYQFLELPEIIRSYNYKRLKRECIEIRNFLNIHKHIKKLISFYDRVNNI